VSSHPTRTRLLDAAEALFARHGLDGTSLRAITTRAGVNLAAVNYHFGTKAGLVAAVFQRRAEPLNRDRLARLAAARQASAPAPPAVETVLDALLRPALALRNQPKATHFLRLLARVFSEPGAIRQEMLSQFRPTAESFLDALTAAAPHVPRRELVWRLHFLIGSMAHALCAEDMIHQQDPAPDEGEEALLRRLIDYGAAGLQAPAAPATKEMT
jgi:AcrR family transcriptional regulator